MAKYMGFLENVVLPNQEKLKTTKTSPSSFLDSVILPTQKSLKTYNINQDINVAQQESKKLNSFGGLIKETIKGLPKAIVDVYKPIIQPTINIAKNTAKYTWETYKQTPQKLVEDIKSGASDIQKGGVINKNKGGAKTLIRTAGDSAIAIFAPLSSAIGAILEEYGGQKLVDKVGQVIADKSGITNIPAFQKFATEHPNAGEDFNRILMLAMSGGEKSKIEPKRILSEVETVAKKIINQAKPAETPIVPEVKSPFLDSVILPKESVKPPVEASTTPKTAPETTITPKIENIIPIETKPIPTLTAKLRKGDIQLSPELEIRKETLNNNPAQQLEPYIATSGEFKGRLPEVLGKGKAELKNTISYGGVKNAKTLKFIKEGDQIIDSINKNYGTNWANENEANDALQKYLEEKKVLKIDTKEHINTKYGEKLDEVALDKWLNKQPILESKVLSDEDILQREFEYDPTFKGTTFKEQAQKYNELLNSDREGLLDIATGKEKAPEGVNASAMAKLFSVDKNLTPEEAIRLTDSPLYNVSKAGQELSLSRIGDGNDPVKILRDVKIIREAIVEKKLGKKITKAKSDTVNEIKNEIKKKSPTKQTWSEFVDSIKCNY